MPKNNKPILDPNERRIAELNALYAISGVLNTTTQQKQALDEVLDILQNDLAMTNATILLLSPDSQEIMIEVASNISENVRKKVRYQVGEGVSGRVIQTGQAMIVPRISQEPLFLDRLGQSINLDKEEASFICVPIKTAASVVGALAVRMVYDENIDLHETEKLLSIIASMIAHDVKSRRQVAADKLSLEQENLRLRSELQDRFRPENIIGNSSAMREIYRAVNQVAPSDTTVLIRGESGTGKELVSHAIHYASPRVRGPFVRVNCAALNENLLESELFGHEKGAFTGATTARIGHVEESENGTLFLDEIGDFSQATQVKLLRVLQEREYKRVGSNKTMKTNARIICATNRDLEQAVKDGDFRQDLYYRINVFPIMLPPLRDRKNDILQLADYFVELHAKKTNKDIRRISTPAINMMVAYHWPGNVRELENCIERAVLLSSDGVIHGHHLPPTLQTSEASETVGSGSLDDRVAMFEREIIIDALKRTDGNLAAAARDIDTTPRIIRYKVKHLSIDPTKFKLSK
ncbi:MAG: sigma 54-interacting transcriptional regulator [Phycisphaerae bacterium]|nr:sigma 54-interacting transcriptional regulator [Phycisphaerae bacterium]